MTANPGRARQWFLRRMYLTFGADWQAEAVSPKRWATQPTQTPLDVLEESQDHLNPGDLYKGQFD